VENVESDGVRNLMHSTHPSVGMRVHRGEIDYIYRSSCRWNGGISSWALTLGRVTVSLVGVTSITTKLSAG
jgi:hypothetical protein